MTINSVLAQRDVDFLARWLLDSDPNIKRILDGEEPETQTRRGGRSDG